MGLLDGFLTQISTGDTMKDYKHASMLFVGDNFRLAPKMGNLYHVYFDLSNNLSHLADNAKIEAGMLVKSVDLPRFTIEAKTLNSYNKPNIVQTKIKYDSINIAFHDDSADVARDLWFDYYHHYYRDADAGSDNQGKVDDSYTTPTKYAERSKNTYGYGPYDTTNNGTRQQYIEAIRIYSLHQKRFSEYTLVNPIITSFKHGSHNSANGNEPMQHDMTISYEFVLYAEGNVSPNTVKGFTKLHYDLSPSSIKPANGTRSILGPGGMINTTDEIINDLSHGDFGAAGIKAIRGIKNGSLMDLKGAALGEITQVGMDILRGNNPMNRIAIPNLGDLGTRAKALVNTDLNGSTGGANSNGEDTNFIAGLTNSATALVNKYASTPGDKILGTIALPNNIAVNTATPIDTNSTQG